MSLRRLFISSIIYIYRYIFSTRNYRCLLLLLGITMISYLIISFSTGERKTQSNLAPTHSSPNIDFIQQEFQMEQQNPTSTHSSPNINLIQQEFQMKEQNPTSTHSSPNINLIQQEFQMEQQNPTSTHSSPNMDLIQQEFQMKQQNLTSIHSSPNIDFIQQKFQAKRQDISILNKEETRQENIETSTKKYETSDKPLNIIIKNNSSPLLINITNSTKKSILSNKHMIHERRLRYSFIDIDHLQVNIDYLDEEYQPPPQEFNISLPSPDSDPLSRLLNVKGDTSVIMYNRIPQCYENTMHSLLENISYLHSYKYVASSIYTPFVYNESSLLTIARSLTNLKYNRLIYERHIYFFDFYSLKLPVHPVWINLVQDPMHRLATEYNRSREICLKTNRCFVQNDAIHETLDECVIKRSPKECISPRHGISRMLPFFCGLKNSTSCQEESDWALKEAKQNIDFFYAVIGLTEEFYKFLYVLEKLLPQYFKLARLLFMNQHDPSQLADIRDINIRLPNERTIRLVRPLLKLEYDLYNYIKQRFLDQYQMLVELHG